MTQTKAFIRHYKYELIAFVVNVVTTITSLMLKDSSDVAAILAVVIFIISIFIVIYFRTQDRDFYFLPLNKPGNEKDWVGRGRFAYLRSEKCFEITNSHAGYIFSKTLLWDDYKLECDFKIVNISIGCIVRAIDLSNYVMYQLFHDRIKPHFRINGRWIILEEVRLEDSLKPDKWYKLIIICEKRNVRIVVYDEKLAVFDRYWKIPNQITISYKQIIEGDKRKREREIMFLQEINFDFGAIGSRNHGDEQAFIKNVFIEKL